VGAAGSRRGTPQQEIEKFQHFESRLGIGSVALHAHKGTSTGTMGTSLHSGPAGSSGLLRAYEIRSVNKCWEAI
jgi:hypothetical protein